MADVKEPRLLRVIGGVALVIALVLLGARIVYGRGQSPTELVVACGVVMSVLFVVFTVITYRTYGRRRDR